MFVQLFLVRFFCFYSRKGRFRDPKTASANWGSSKNRWNMVRSSKRVFWKAPPHPSWSKSISFESGTWWIWCLVLLRNSPKLNRLTNPKRKHSTSSGIFFCEISPLNHPYITPIIYIQIPPMSFVQGLGDLGGGILALILYLGTTTKRNWLKVLTFEAVDFLLLESGWCMGATKNAPENYHLPLLSGTKMRHFWRLMIVSFNPAVIGVSVSKRDIFSLIRWIIFRCEAQSRPQGSETISHHLAPTDEPWGRC